MVTRAGAAVTRILSDDKTVHSRALNLLGSQVLRALAARALYRLRPETAEDTVRSHVHQLRQEGLLLLPDFLSPQHFADVVRECERLDNMVSSTWGPNVLKVVRIKKCKPELLPHVHRFFGDRRLLDIIRAAERRPLDDLAQHGRWEILTQGPAEPARVDPQTRLHSDVFFNSHKAWLYLDDVAVEDGPLVYVRRSHRLSPGRLWFMYRDSCRRDPAADPSRRISREEQQWTAEPETTVTCPRNTLVIVNVCGYHRRLQGGSGRQRRALSLTLRGHPFSFNPSQRG